MSTLGIYTVKELRLHGGRYYTFGGFGDYLSEIRKYFAKTILVCHVRKAPPPPNGWYEVTLENMEIVAFPPGVHQVWVTLNLPRMIFTAFRASRRMDVIHARMPDYSGVVGVVAADRSGVPCFCQIIDDWYEFALSTSPSKLYGLGFLLRQFLFLYDWIERCAARGKLVFAQGHTCYVKHAGRSDCHEVLSSAHHPEDVVLPRPKFTNKPYTILNVARLNGVKNQALLIAALARLNADSPDWRLKLVGEGSQEASLRQTAAQRGVSQFVDFTGQIAHGAELWKQFDTADVFALSSLSEGTPKVVLEAMARGLPVVATAVSGVPSAVAHEQRGLLYESRDVDGLVASIIRMRDDSALRERCQAQAATFAAANTVEEATRSMLRLVFERWPQLDNTVDGTPPAGRLS
jgi:glycosyltransferase involved in cell wall biosynthesis